MLAHQNEQPDFNRLIQVLWQHPEYSPEQAVRVLQQEWEKQQGGERQGNVPGREQQSPLPDPQQAQPQPPSPPCPPLGAPQQPPQQMPGQPAPAKASNPLAFNLDKTVASALAMRPSEYAIKCLEAFKYVPLWYFMLEGLANATRVVCQDDTKESLALTQEMEGGLALHPTLSVTASKHAKYDHNLAFPNFLYAKCNFLVQIECAKWPPAVIDSFNWFFYNLENHVLRQQAKEEKRFYCTMPVGSEPNGTMHCPQSAST
ncbi:hypothetical protein ID866_10535 [Astraeus odoratus]|nr:hypothetical protein ID866_10535 [Astraeus odoratus]